MSKPYPRRAALSASVIVGLLASFAVAAPASAASGSFTNPAPITLDTSDAVFGSSETPIVLEDPSGPESPSSSTIELEAPADAEISDISLTVGINHERLDDVDLMLVSPSGTGTMLLSDAGGANAYNSSILFGPTGKAFADDQISSGNCFIFFCDPFGAVDWDTTTGDSDAFASPAPASAPDDFDDLFGTSPTGTWSLYAMDDTEGSTGAINGWNLTVNYSTPASPDPSGLAVTGLPKSVTDVNLTLTDIDLPSLQNTELVLESPDGRRAKVLGDAGGDPENNSFPECPFFICGPGGVIFLGDEVEEAPGDGITLTLDDEAANPVRRNYLPPSGSYQPVDYDDGDSSEFVSGFDTRNLSSSLSTFDGADPNGTWKLYVAQESGSIEGVIHGGWSLDITTADATAAPVITSPANGTRDADGAVTLTGTAATGSSVKVGVGDKARNTVAEDGTWTVTFGDLPNGSHTFVATATDSSGNVSAPAAVTVLVDRTPAVVVVPETETDTEAPKVRTVKPRKDEDRIKVSASALVRFSEAMDVASVKKAVTLRDVATGKAVKVELSYKPSKNRLTINPERALQHDTTYMVVVNKSATDLAGNALQKTRKSRFSTR